MPDSILSPQTYRKTTPRSSVVKRSGFSKLRTARLRAVLQRYVDSGDVPGVVALVHQRGRQHVEVVGSMAFGGNQPVERDTLFRLASTTKPITAVAAMTLVEECRLRLDDPVEPWLPELGNRKVLRTLESPIDDTVPARRPISLRDLLTFRCGYGEVAFISPTCPYQKALSEARLPLTEWPFAGTAEEFMKRLGGLPLACQPGERWLYHMGAEILGVLIARVTGKSLGAFLEERIFEPLGMSDTGFYVPVSQLDRLPFCYGRDLVTGELVVLDQPRSGYVSRPPVFESGAGGLVSTADDLLAFGRMMLPRGVSGVERILSQPSIELMTMDHLTPEQKAASPFFENFWEGRGWGLGLGVVTARHDLAEGPGRFGWDGAYGTSWHVDPREGLIGVLMTQRRPDRLAIPPIVLDFWTSAYQLIDD